MVNKKLLSFFGIGLLVIGLLVFVFVQLFQETFIAEEQEYTAGESINFDFDNVLTRGCDSLGFRLVNIDADTLREVSTRKYATGRSDVSKGQRIIFSDNYRLLSTSPVGDYFLVGYFICRENNFIASASERFYYSVIESCKDECVYFVDEIGRGVCSGEQLKVCVFGDDGCTDYKYDYVINKCGVECLTESDCRQLVGIGASCIDKKCEPLCNPDVQKKCYEGDVWWYDSCGERGNTRAERCSESEECIKGQCVEIKICPDVIEKKCFEGDVWVFDGCGDKQHIDDECEDDEVCEGDKCVLKSNKCDEKPTKPCDGAEWKGLPNCEWDTSGCDTCKDDVTKVCGDIVIVTQKCVDGKLEDTGKDCPSVGCEVNEDCDSGFCVEGECKNLCVGAGCVVELNVPFAIISGSVVALGILFLILGLRKRKKKKGRKRK